MCELHEALTRCDTYPDAPMRVDFIETHISCLYLTDSLVYKIKKPVNFGFCDFTRLDRRRFYCEEEVRLNRRLTSDSYLGVSKIVRHGDKFAIDQPGEIVEYAVRMRRLPDQLMLDRLITNPEQNNNLPALINRVGNLLASFHRQAPRLYKGTHDDLRVMQANWQQNFEQTGDCPAAVISPAILNNLEQLIERYLQENAERFDSRQELGYVRDGHGDLHSEHICMSEPIQIFDCIEFNPGLRTADILNDLAFLYMDLELHHRTDLANRLWLSYQSGIKIGPHAESLLNFYSLYRAWVRGKVHHFQAKLSGGQIDHQRQARDYFHLASRYALPQLLLCCCGLIGSGKSTLARDLGTALQAKVISSDLVRGMGHAPRRENQGYDQGRYRPENRLALYQKIAEQVEQETQTGQTLVIDATFENRQMRLPFQELALHAQIPCYFIETTCPENLIRMRLRQRSKDPGSSYGSEAGLQHFEQQRQRFEPLSSKLLTVRVDTGQPREYNVDFVIENLLQVSGTLS
ncbi:AAA family ATPase [Geopsychrobacter electrodiphilus]|uniref:bifunctional aminoglycoside phosphotransferase/ATP-binding protein n=1 Tax=Geopsychrobacter electrodiphilus TaxID=225196 RepID=UPI0003801547|nr:bifunctional aminoglycoside phosphotransferase/ATP-binding protein [Geopsychrobacter electrodiphilus]